MSSEQTTQNQSGDINETKTAKIKSKYFDRTKISELVHNAVDQTLANQVYRRDLAKQWIESVTESVMAHLRIAFDQAFFVLIYLFKIISFI